MNQQIIYVTLVVRAYDEAIAYFTHMLGFDLVADTDLGNGKRWVLVRPPGGGGTCLLLAQASSPTQVAHIGDQTGGRVGWFLHSDNFWGDYDHMKAHGVRFSEEPRHEPYGWVVVFLDLYGNRWDLLEQPL